MTHTYTTQILQLVERRLALAEQMEDSNAWDAIECRRELLAERRLQEEWEQLAQQGQVPQLEYLFRVFGLSRFQRHCVYMSLAPELDGTYEQRFASLQERRSYLPTLELCLNTFPAPEEERTQLLAQWRGSRQVLSYFFRPDPQSEQSIGGLAARLKLDTRILDFLFDIMSPDPVLKDCGVIHWPGEEETVRFALYQGFLEKMKGCCAGSGKEHVLFYLKGEQGAGRRTLAKQLCREEGRPLLEVNLPQLMDSVPHVDQALIPLCRETVIRNAALMLTGLERLMGEGTPYSAGEDSEKKTRNDWKDVLRILLTQLTQVTDRLFLVSEDGWDKTLSCAPWQKTELELDTPNTADRMALWQQYLEGIPLDRGVELESAAIKFALNPGQIAAAAKQTKRLAAWDGVERVSEDILHRACRAQLSHNLGRMASRVNAAYTWDDLILPPVQKQMLKNACAQVEYRHRVFDQWGFGKKVAYGQGLSMLFSGPPGTGKTMAAQVIANRLGLELYKVDLAGVMSKYVGETEKQLGAVFDEVKKSQSILFFDEADAMFGKRTETKDAHDQYANVQTAYLLQKMEEYDGIIILASNFLQNFDEAFKRRLKFIIEFTLPDREHREQIWRSVLPPELPLQEDLDFDFLARSFELSGSSIKNIAVAAAFLAAEEGVPMGMAHLLTATQSEQNKTGKSVGQEELGEYYHQVRAYQAMIHGRSE